MKPKLRTRLVISGAGIDFAVINRVTALAASETWRRGDPIGKTRIARKQDGWVYESPHLDGYHLGDAIEELASRLGPKTDELRLLCKQHTYTVCINCVAEMSDETPSVSLTEGVLAWLCRLGASFDLDLYVVDEPVPSANISYQQG